MLSSPERNCSLGLKTESSCLSAELSVCLFLWARELILVALSRVAGTQHHSCNPHIGCFVSPFGELSLLH